ncbi:MAG: hypothetical protein ACKN9V_04710 [Pseudomonadota bacterium]
MIPKEFRFRCAIDWTWADPIGEESFTLVKKLLKLFPFEVLSVEVDFRRSRDVFSDWDSYLEWFKAEKPAGERLFSRIKISRQRKTLGLMVWEKGDLAIYTEHDQVAPITKACETMQPLIISVSSSRVGFKLFQFLR